MSLWLAFQETLVSTRDTHSHTMFQTSYCGRRKPPRPQWPCGEHFMVRNWSCVAAMINLDCQLDEIEKNQENNLWGCLWGVIQVSLIRIGDSPLNKSSAIPWGLRTSLKKKGLTSTHLSLLPDCTRNVMFYLPFLLPYPCPLRCTYKISFAYKVLLSPLSPEITYSL